MASRSLFLLASLALALAPERFVSIKAASIPIIAMTISSSIRVKPLDGFLSIFIIMLVSVGTCCFVIARDSCFTFNDYCTIDCGIIFVF